MKAWLKRRSADWPGGENSDVVGLLLGLLALATFLMVLIFRWLLSDE
jgi:hypothetical protein